MTDSRTEDPAIARHPTSRELAGLGAFFLRLGFTAFGGPAAHIAIMQDETVHRRRWLTSEEFLRLLGASNLIPGPSSTEMAIHIGRERAGWRGLVIAGGAFILPAALITAALAWAYQRFGAVPAVGSILYGIKPVVIALILQALLDLTPKALKNRSLTVIGLLATAGAAAGANQLALLIAAGIGAAALQRAAVGRKAPRPPTQPGHNTFGALAVAKAISGGAAVFSLPKLFLIFAKIGAVIFGSGYVLLSFLHADLVGRFHWLTETQLLDAVAIGQVTPGPVFTTATFIGYILAGPRGAAIATIGIFLPAFVFAALSGVLLASIQRSRTAVAFFEGVSAASLALILVVTVQLARNAIVDLPCLLILAIGALVLIRYRPNPSWLVLGGAVSGVLVHTLK